MIYLTMSLTRDYRGRQRDQLFSLRSEQLCYFRGREVLSKTVSQEV